MLTEDLLAWKDLGIGAIAMIVFYMFATTVTNNATKQLTQLHNDFLAAYKENTKALSELVASFEKHTSTKDAAIKLLQDKFEKNEWKRIRKDRIMGDQ